MDLLLKGLNFTKESGTSSKGNKWIQYYFPNLGNQSVIFTNGGASKEEQFQIVKNQESELGKEIYNWFINARGDWTEGPNSDNLHNFIANRFNYEEDIDKNLPLMISKSNYLKNF